MPKPTFIICGAPKSGTSALFGYLEEHPEVCTATIKEPVFFTRAEGQMHTGLGVGMLRGGTWNRGWAWYESLYEKKEETKVFGEATTHYLEAEDSPELIHQYLPEIKLIFLLREPVSRIYSHYWQERKTGIRLPDFPTMVADNHPRFQYFSSVSHYEKNLKRFLKYFSREQVLVLIHDALREDPLGVFQEVCCFLGVDQAFVPSTLGEEFNRQVQPRVALIERWTNGLTHPVIRENIPPRFRSRLSKIKKSITRLNSTKFLYEKLDPALRMILTPSFEEDVRYVEKLTGTSLDPWRSL